MSAERIGSTIKYHDTRPPTSIRNQELFEGTTTCTDVTTQYNKRRPWRWQVPVVLSLISIYCITTLRANQLPTLFINSSKVKFEEATASFGPEGWSDVKLLLYMTTHLPDTHIAFLPCWKDAIERLDLFKYADLMLYTSAEPTEEQLEFLPFRNITIKKYTNLGYQEGAVAAMVEPFLESPSWFDDYDWVMRVNADVLIRHDTWLMETMLNTSVDMIVHECWTDRRYGTNPNLHSDFFAFRPRAVDRERLLATDRSNAELHFTAAFRHLYDERRFAYVEGAKNIEEGQCRIAGVHSPILHVHEMSDYCPYFYNVTKEGFYR